MAEGTILIGSTSLETPAGYTHDPIKLESDEFSINGTLLTTRIVTAENQPKNKYTFVVNGITNSLMYDIKAEVAYFGNLDYVDYIQIVERLSGDGVTTTFYAQRRMSGATPVPVVTLSGVSKIVVVSDLVNPAAGYVYAKADVSGRARFTFGDIPPAVNNNIVIRYEPKYYVRIPADGFKESGIIGTVRNYTLICKEAK